MQSFGCTTFYGGIMDKTMLCKIIKDGMVNPEKLDTIGITFINGTMLEIKNYQFDKRHGIQELNSFSSSCNESGERKNFRILPGLQSRLESIITEFLKIHKLQIDSTILMNMCRSEVVKEGKRARLTQLGVQQKSTKERILKSYFSLRKFTSARDVVGKRQRYIELKDVLENLYIPSSFCCFLEEISEILERNGYYPSLLGINQSDTEVEYKIYYELFNPDLFFEHIKEHTEGALRNITSHLYYTADEFVESNCYCIEGGLFLRGIAVSDRTIKQGSVIRLYFAPMNRFI